jgi:hypothetical protein
MKLTDKQIDDMLRECGHTPPFNRPHCFVDPAPDGTYPEWAFDENGMCWWYELKDGMSLNIGIGKPIPLWTRYILCAEHKRILEEAGVTFSV